ncbi:MAG: prolyl aminopeptidase [Bdellovibrionaceae bacterium]|nr:prolyl aminopeptidase [Pseudobdellovibrionaceae bacterium]
MRDFYPEIEPYNSASLKVSDLHEIYYEQVGNPKGQPVVFLHGGPGGGTNSDHRRYFDPARYRVILFDQRGCGRSKPFAELRENTTWDLVKDIEKLRAHLGIEKWLVFGGSWGSTLALTYAIQHADRVQGLLLRGIFLCRPSEIRWFYQEGASHVFPDIWDEYRDLIPPSERDDFVKAYYQRLTSDDQGLRLEAARTWSRWEMATSYLRINFNAINSMEEPEKALPFARIEAHYFINNAFFPSDNWILENIERIQHIPTAIVQGRYDMVCPARSAWELHRAFPKSKLEIIPDAGHSASEPGIRSALIAFADEFARI